MSSRLLWLSFAAIVLCISGSARAGLLPYSQRPETSVYISVGDCLWFGHLTPVSSAGSIEAVFDAWKTVYKTNRIFWRGGQDEIILDHMGSRPENPIYHEFYASIRQAYKKRGLNALAVTAARRRGMGIWLYHALFDYGGAWEDGVFDYLPPYGQLDELIERNPQFSPIDRSGHRRGSGTICFAYPEVRDALVRRLTDFVVGHDFDGLMFYTYVESFWPRFNDEFGYNEPIVQEFKRRYGIDVRREKFDKLAWHKLQGEYVTEFLSRLQTAFKPRDKKLGVVIEEGEEHYPMRWYGDPTMRPAGNIYLDWEKWIREGIINELLIRQTTGREMMSLLGRALDLARQSKTACRISFFTPSFEDDRWRPMTARGAIPVVADGSTPADRGYPELQSPDALRGTDPCAKLAVLGQMSDGKTVPMPDEILKSAADANLLVRRKALLTIGRLKIPGGTVVLEQALSDSEPAIRCAALVGLSQVPGTQTPGQILTALRRDTANFAFVNSVMECLSKLPDDLFAAVLPALSDRDAAVRMVIAWSVFRSPTDFKRDAAVTPLLEIVVNDPDSRARYCAAWALDRFRDPCVVDRLTDALDDPAVAVQHRAAASLVNAAGPFGSQLTPRQQTIVDRLKARFREFRSGGSRPDQSWGWRPAGTALLACGPAGQEVLERILSDPAEDLTLRQRAFLVLRIPRPYPIFDYQKVSEQENDKIWQSWPAK